MAVELMELMEASSGRQLEELQAASERVRGYLFASMSSATRRAYRSDWADFTSWCEDHRVVALPASPETVALYLSALADRLKPSTLTRRASAISQAHQAAGFDTPTSSILVRKALAGIRRAKGTAPAVKAPVTVADLQAIAAEHLPAGIKGTRDRALLLVGFLGAFRRSELVGIDVEHLAFVPEGVVVTIPRSKTDQEGAGQTVAVPYGQHPDTCAVAALRAWLDAAGITSGPVFRRVDRHGNVGSDRLTGKAVAEIVKSYAVAIGREADAYAGHSLRAGLATAAARAGVQEREIMRQTRHTSVTMVRRYIRDGSLFRANAAGALGL